MYYVCAVVSIKQMYKCVIANLHIVEYNILYYQLQIYFNIFKYKRKYFFLKVLFKYLTSTYIVSVVYLEFLYD